MPRIDQFEDIEAWQDARELVSNIYQCCGRAPLGKDFGLYVALDNNLINESDFNNLQEQADKVARKLSSFRRYLKSTLP